MDVLDRMGKPDHPEEEYLERYVMKACKDQELDAIEAHLLLCEHCRARLYQAEEWVSLMKMALPLSPSRQRKPSWLERLQFPQRAGQFFAHPMAMAAGCVALLALLVAGPISMQRQRPSGEELVELTATRGQTAAIVHAGKVSRLHLDARDLVEPLEGQIVDLTGAPVWTEPITLEKPELRPTRPLKPGSYWVRINSRQGEHEILREFQIQVK